jgi:serine/threonine protein kinase
MIARSVRFESDRVAVGKLMDQEEDQIDVVLAQYLAERESNPATPIDDFESRLPPERRPELHRLLETVELADRQLPGGKPPRAVFAGRYQLESRLGEGGFGDVWQGFDATLQRRVAVKVLSRSAADGWAGDALREARLLSALDHPGIVRILDAGEDDGSPFLVMELLPGRTLHQVLTALRALGRRPTGADLARELAGLPNALHLDLQARGSYHRAIAFVFAEAARGLHAAHRCSVVHRDLKPANLLLRPGGQPTWLDFGLAGHMQASGGASVRGVVGTPQYLAPEQIRSDKMGRDPRLDVYQLGVMLYEALTLQPAFQEEQRDQVYARILAGRFRWPCRVDPELPRTLEDVCLRSMHPRADGRYQDMQQFAADLDRASAGELPAASHHRVGPLSPLRTWLLLRRHRVPVGVFAALAAVLVLGMWLGGSKLQVVMLALRERSTVFGWEKSEAGVMPMRLALDGKEPPASGGFGVTVDKGEHRATFERSLPGALQAVVMTLPAESAEAKALEGLLVALEKERTRGSSPAIGIERLARHLDGGASPLPSVAQFLGDAPWPVAQVQRVTLR